VQGALANLGNAIRTLNQYEIDQTPARKDALSNYSNKDQEITVDGIVHRVSLDELFETIKTNNSEASIRLGNKLTALADVLIRYKGGHFLFGSKRLRDEVVEAYRLYVQEQQRQQPVEH
jgi:hypothetical protein